MYMMTVKSIRYGVMMPREIDPALLRTFVAVTETCSMTAASRHLNLTQAAVSQQIKRLEDLFQTQLLLRSKRGLSLTSDGDRLLPHALRMLAVNDETWGFMNSKRLAGKVSVGVPHDIIDAFMPQILRKFAQAWPGIEVTMVSSDTTHLFEAREKCELDLILTTEANPAEDGWLLQTDQLVWTGAPGGSAYRRTPLPITLGEFCTFRAAATEVLSDANRDWRFIPSSINLLAIRASVSADLAVAPLLSQTVPSGLSILGRESGLPDLPNYFINLYTSRASMSEYTSILADFIREGFAPRSQKAA